MAQTILLQASQVQSKTRKKASKKSTTRKKPVSKKKSVSRKKASSSKKAIKKTGSVGRTASLAKILEDKPHYQTRINGRDIVVLGTAHVSQQSVEDVEVLYDKMKPGTVAVELCQPRYDAMRDPDRWSKLDLAQVIKEKKFWLLVSSLILSAFQKKIGETTGVKPGAEMSAAIDKAGAGGSRIALVDREVRITLRRAWARVGFFQRLWLASYLMASLLVSEEIEAEEIENLKQKDVLEDMMAALPRRYQHIKEVIIDERDKYLAEKIRQTAYEADGRGSVMAVVGAGHLPGIRRVLEADAAVDLGELDETPPKSRAQLWTSLAIFLGISASFTWVTYFVGVEKGMQEAASLAMIWVIGRAAGAGLGAIIARGRLITILATTLVAPFAYFLGFFGFRLWMLSALLELRFKKPRVEDFENIAHDTDTLGDFWRAISHNRVIHLIVLVFAVSMGLTLGNLTFMFNFVKTILDAAGVL